LLLHITIKQFEPGQVILFPYPSRHPGKFMLLFLVGKPAEDFAGGHPQEYFNKKLI